MHRVGVIGCGTAGAATAIALARIGCEVTVLERVAEPKPVGAGIVLQPTGQAMLARLGLLDVVAASGARLDRLWVRTPRGRTLIDLRYAMVDRAWFGIGLHRGVLFQTLYEAARVEPNVRVVTGRDVRGLRREGRKIYAVDTERADHGPFDLLVVADGAVSELRTAAGVTANDTQYPWGALWFVGRDPDRVFTGQLYQVGVRAHRLYGALPTGQSPDGGTPVVSLFWSMAESNLAAWRAAGLDAWKAEVRALDPRIEHVLDQITEPSQLLFARYRDVRMLRWHDRGVVFVGDAAHATSPQLGQGANLALLDAIALADAVAASPDIDVGLAGYQATRRHHLAHYQRMTRWLTPFFQSHSRALGWARDWIFPLGNLLPPIRRFMITTMAGVSRGPLRANLALPPLRISAGATPPSGSDS